MKKRAAILSVVSVAVVVPLMAFFLYDLGAQTLSTNQQIESLKADMKQNCMQLRTDMANSTVDQVASREKIDVAQLQSVIDECKSNGYWFNSTSELVQR